MATWQDLIMVTMGKKEWVVRDGEALWMHPKLPIVVHVRAYVPPTTLEPKRERLNKVLKGEPVEFEGYFMTDKVVTFLEARHFTQDWMKLWPEDDFVWINLIDAPPIDHKLPVSLEFTPDLYEEFNKRLISQTSMAPVWGQHRSYFGEMEWELNAFGRMNNNKKIKWQQEWVEINMWCPFCLHTKWNLTYAHVLEKADEYVYDPERQYYALLCPKCERCVECIPRQLVK